MNSPTPSPPKPRRRLKRHLLLVASALLSLLLATALLELYLRWRLPPMDAPSMYEVDLDLGKRLLPGFKGQSMGAEVEINALGLRDHETTLTRRPGSARILALGDSWTFGPAVKLEETWPEQLEALLGGPDRVEVLNTGVAGYSTYKEATYYARDLGKFEHDLVLVGFYPENDVSESDERLARHKRLHDIHPLLLDAYMWPRRHLMIMQVYNTWRLERRNRRRQAFYARQCAQDEPGRPTGGFRDGQDDWTQLYRDDERAWQVCRQSLIDIGATARARAAARWSCSPTCRTCSATSATATRASPPTWPRPPAPPARS